MKTLICELWTIVGNDPYLVLETLAFIANDYPLNFRSELADLWDCAIQLA